MGRKFNLNGNGEAEQMKNSQCLCQVMDMRNGAVQLFYLSPEEFNVKKDAYVQRVTGHFVKFEEWLKHNKTDYLSANEPRTADFHLFEMLDQHEKFAKDIGKPSFLDQYTHLKQFYERFAALPAIKKYLASDLGRLDCNNTNAAWRGQYQK